MHVHSVPPASLLLHWELLCLMSCAVCKYFCSDYLRVSYVWIWTLKQEQQHPSLQKQQITKFSSSRIYGIEVHIRIRSVTGSQNTDKKCHRAFTYLLIFS